MTSTQNGQRARPIITTQWLFKLLGYEHWQIRVDGEPIGQVIINPTDRTVRLDFYDDPRKHLDLKNVGNWRDWLKWLAEHENEVI